MRGARRYLVVAALVSSMVVAASVIAWLFCTSDGIRRLMGAVSDHTELKITANRVEGSLLGRLSLAGVRISSKWTETEIDGIAVRWRPFLLLTGRVSVKELSLHGIRIADNTPASGRPPELQWPRLSRLSELLDGKIDTLRLRGVSYRHRGGAPVVVDSISATCGWRFRILDLRDLAVETPAGRMKGDLSAGFGAPFLKTELLFLPARPVAGSDTITFKSRLNKGRGEEQLAGSFTITAGPGLRKRMELSGEAAITRHSVTLRRLRMVSPGRRGEVTGECAVDLTPPEPVVKLSLALKSLDLASETGMATDLSGELKASGSMDHYSGTFSLGNGGQGWRNGDLRGAFNGNGKAMDLTDLRGRLLKGKVSGELAMEWEKGFALKGKMTGENLDPAQIDPHWKGEINFELSGDISRQGKGPLVWNVDARLKESRLHGRALTGEVRAGAVGDNLNIANLLLKGRGFTITGSGELRKRVEFTARVGDLSRLVPDTAGEVAAKGWIRWRNGAGEGSISLHGASIALPGVKVAELDLSASLDRGKGYPIRMKGRLAALSMKKLRIDSMSLAGDGTLSRHRVTASLSAKGSAVSLSLSGGYQNRLWEGEVISLSGRDGVGPWAMERRTGLKVGADSLSVSPLVIRGVGGERLELAGRLQREPVGGDLRLEWEGIDLSRLSGWLEDVSLSGTSSGTVLLKMPGGERLDLYGRVTAAGTVSAEGKSVTVQRGSLTLRGGGDGFRSALEIRTSEGGALSGTFASSAPARIAVPEQGEFSVEWRGIDLVLLRPWIPERLGIDGVLDGKAKGSLRPGRHLEMEGKTSLARGRVRWRDPKGEINLELGSASLTWGWRGEALNGNAELSLVRYGEVRGSFRLPLPARLPTEMEPEGELRASFTGRFREKGMITLLFPEMVRETSGEAEAGVEVRGPWKAPVITGDLRLAKAGAYLPTAGIHLKDVGLVARMEKGVVRIESLRASSGSGKLAGSAVITLDGRRVAGFRGKIDGERFRTVHFPELRLSLTPHLTFEGTPEKVSVRGDLRVPELIINNPPAGRVVKASSDVVVEGREKKGAKKGPPMALDLRVKVVLGDKVVIKDAGIDARLAGEMELTATGPDRITSKGEIRVVEGSYRTYGVNLDIVRGRLFYAGGPINRPTLDVLALRTIGEVKAGVTVGGVLQEPVVRLYSIPSMGDADILSYIVLGHPLGGVSTPSQTDLLAQAAGALLSSSQATDLRGEIKNRLGLSTLGFETSSGATTGGIGYKPIATSPPGAAQPVTASESLLTVGKYLTPKLYLSYGRALFSGGNLFRLRYDVSKHWQVETQTGTESGGDIFFTVEFD